MAQPLETVMRQKISGLLRISGSYRRPPQTDPDARRRELW
jgi:hypothetical protein